MRKSELTDPTLCQAVAEMTQGLIDADLGGGVIKKRVGLAGRGKRGRARARPELGVAVMDGLLQEICHGDSKQSKKSTPSV